MDVQSLMAYLLLAVYFLVPCVIILFGLGKHKVMNVLLCGGCMVVATAVVLMLDIFPELVVFACAVICICAAVSIFVSVDCIIYRINGTSTSNKKTMTPYTSIKNLIKRIFENKLFFIIPLLFAVENIINFIILFDWSFKNKFYDVLLILMFALSIVLIVIVILNKFKKTKNYMLCGIIYLLLVLISLCCFFCGNGLNMHISAKTLDVMLNTTAAFLYIKGSEDGSGGA